MSNNDIDVDGMPKAPAPAGYGRSASMDLGEAHMHSHGNKAGPPPLYPRGGYGYSHHAYSSTRPTLPIKSVVTTSFEEREDSRMEHRDAAASFPHQDYGMHHSRSHHPTGGRDDAFQVFEPPHLGREQSHHSSRGPPHAGMPMRDPPQMDRETPQHGGRELPHYGREVPMMRDDEMEARHPPHDMRESRPVRIPPSPRDGPFIHRSHSAGAPVLHSYHGKGPLKRSFWHHARSGGDEYQTLPNEFMPPKRSKVTPPSGRRGEYVVTARPHPDDPYPIERHASTPPSRSPGWFNRAMSWEASRDDYYHREPNNKVYTGSWSSRSPPYREGGPSQHWSDAPIMPSPRSRYSSNEIGYEGSPGQSWGRWHHTSDSHPWGVPQHRDESESKYMGADSRDREGFVRDMRRQGTFESGAESEPPMRYIPGPSHGMDQAHHMVAPRLDAMINDMDKKTGPLRLLALPEDRISLSETLCIVRENIEVFTATIEDVEAPAPGRKHAVVVGQVGLRCIHCRHTTRSSERVKRAVCYPSSIKRIYRTVIDMKLDHFLHCKFVPNTLKDTLNALKANNTRSTGTTMQYFIRAAGILGMVDGTSGVRLVENSTTGVPPSVSSPPGSTKPVSTTDSPSTENSGKIAAATPESAKSESEKDEHKKAQNGDFLIHRKNSISSESSTASATVEDDTSMPKEIFTGKIPLALPEDKMSLSPLRCFLREQVCAFSATEEDIAVRTPTTFSVSVGQVGIGCVHCFNQPAKSRLNRAVCFPFSVARIYQSVADIQRFHLGECKMVPPKIKEEFNKLQSASTKGSKGLATRQYWVTSAKKIGLVDTPKGIRFNRDPSSPDAKAVSLDILAQVASNVNTVNRPLVLPEDKPFIAEFLYVVMEQLQACRFTEADRNKRRLKDVGCLGVECKHCAGQVDGRKFFWSNVSAVESNFVSVHTHMMECRCIEPALKEKLSELKKLRKEQTAALKTGSQKAFFSRVWERLHGQEKAAEEQAAKAAADEKSKQEESSSGDCNNEIKASASVDEMSRDSIQATPISSPVTPRNELTIEESLAVDNAIPTSPASAEKIKDMNEKMAVVTV